ncbi:MAG: tetratricopeptide repeat protein [Verrucomicrobia bacterium]|nr:tetratricopeptide repeat protein [Verrucomicrobiota bacterium]
MNRLILQIGCRRRVCLGLFAFMLTSVLVCPSLADVSLDDDMVLSGEGPLLPRSSGPRSARELMPPADELVEPAVPSVVMTAEGTEDEREAGVPEDRTNTLGEFLDEMLEQGSVWPAIPATMGMNARRTYLEDRSIRSYREGIVRFPDSSFVPSAHMRIAAIYARRGEWRAALREYEMLLERFPEADTADDARLERARVLFDAGDCIAARDEAYLLIDSYLDSPLQVNAYLLAGRAHKVLGEWDAAAQAFEHVIRLTVHGSAHELCAREGLASVELALGHMDRAARIYEELLREARSQAERDTRQFALARLYLAGGETARARASLRGIVYGYELNVYRPAAAFMLADSYYADGAMAHALKYYSVALADFPSYEQRIPALFRAADAYKRLALYTEALDMLRRVPAARDPAPTPQEVSRSKMLAGEVLLLDGEWAMALEELYGAAAGDLTSADRDLVAYWIAQSYYSAGYYNEALEAYDMALQRAPEHALALEGVAALAACYVKKGWLDDARRQYMRIIDGGREDDTPAQLAVRSRAAIQLLDSFSNHGLCQDELNWAQRLLEKKAAFVDEAQVLYRMGRAYERLNNPERAEALYDEVQRRFRGTLWADRAVAKASAIAMMKQIKDASK